MTEAEQLDQFIRLHESDIFIEAAGCKSSLKWFLEAYNEKHQEKLDIGSDGIIALHDNTVHWRVELKLFMHTRTEVVEAFWNTGYRREYAYKITDRGVIIALLDMGYRIGKNQI